MLSDQTKRAIWIDLDNSPHVPLFAPIIKHFREHGVSLLVTARDHAQTVELLNLDGLAGTYDIIGIHDGGKKLNKLRGLFVRATQLARKVRSSGLDIAVAVSHGSRSMVVAALWLKIPVLTMYDYEHTETRIFNRLSDRVLVPDAIPGNVLDKIGLRKSKRVVHEGLKEEVYLRSFVRDPSFRERFARENALGFDHEAILVVLRPPATTANYHDPRSESLLRNILDHLRSSESVSVIIVPRSKGQAAEIESVLKQQDFPPNRFLILRHAVNGLDLADAADVMISGGGTMNREAVLLGVPVYSIFSGRLGSIDALMEHDGLMTFIRDAADVQKIRLVKRDPNAPRPILTDRVERFIIDQINSFVKPS